jgi:hypothetical protein
VTSGPATAPNNGCTPLGAARWSGQKTLKPVHGRAAALPPGQTGGGEGIPPWGAVSAACGCPSQAGGALTQLDLVAEAGVWSHDRIPFAVPCLVSALVLHTLPYWPLAGTLTAECPSGVYSYSTPTARPSSVQLESNSALIDKRLLSS